MNADPRVVNCPKHVLDFQCEKRWKHLRPTENPKQAYCDECNEGVHLCVTLEDFEAQREHGHCVSIPLKAAFFEPEELFVPRKTSWMGRPSRKTTEEIREADHLKLQAWWDENVDEKQNASSVTNANIAGSKFGSAYMPISFADIKEKVPNEPGIYQISTKSGVPLKVGISKNLKKRLTQHAGSRDCLNKDGIDPPEPKDLESKQSILAKHLYFDRAIAAKRYDLTTMDGRRAFLAKECFIKFRVTKTKTEARALEIPLEASGKFRYAGTVRVIEE